jgi:hypothetical protein
MGKLCVSDPENLSRVCAKGNQIDISLTKKAQNEFKKAQKDYEKKNPTNSEERKHFEQIMKSSLGSHLTLQQSDVKASTCVQNPQGYDQLVILHPKESLIDNTFQNPILPIAIQKGKCDKFVQNTFLKNSNSPKEVFVNTAKNELSDLRQHIE